MLVHSAAGRHFAIDLVEKYHGQAIEVIKRMLAEVPEQSDEYDVLISAHRELCKLLPIIAKDAGWRGRD